jgi:catechol 2,3-dioxygenase-like lactoylglutathione lyase family enzyme
MNLSTARVFVGDLAAAHRFYSQVLGLPLQAGAPATGYCVYGSGNCQLVVELVPADAPEEDRVLVGRFTGLSFTVSDIQAQYQALVGKGVHFSGQPERQQWGGTLATLRDPAGNELQLVQLGGAA